MEVNQQSILRHAMQTLGLSRDSFAMRIAVTRRCLDSWLLPDNSTGFRRMNPKVQDVIFNILREQELEDSSEIQEGMISPVVPVIHCDRFNFNFPTLYRITYTVDGIDFEIGLHDPSKDCLDYGYALCDTAETPCSNMRVLRAEPIKSRNTEHDHGWLYITEHRSLDRADAHSHAILNTLLDYPMGTFTLYRLDGHIFSLCWLSNPARDSMQDCMTVYSSDKYLYEYKIGFKHKTTVAGSDFWFAVFDASGQKGEFMYGPRLEITGWKPLSSAGKNCDASD